MSQIVKEKEQKIRHQSRKLEKVPSGHAAIEYESFTEMDRQKEKELVHQQRLQLDRIDEGQTPNDPNNVSLDLSHQNYAADSSEKFMKRERSFSQSGCRS